jgi:hypothetical protein
VADDEVAEQVDAKSAAVGAAALSDAIGVQKHPVTGFQLLGVGGQAIVAARQRPVDTAVRAHVKLGQAQRQLRSASEFLDHLVAADQQRRRVPAGIQLNTPVATSRSHNSAVTNRLSPNWRAMAWSARVTISCSVPPERRALRQEAIATLASSPAARS